jgi:hypothetical protein
MLKRGDRQTGQQIRFLLLDNHFTAKHLLNFANVMDTVSVSDE